MCYPKFEVNSISDEDWGWPAKILLAPESPGTGAMHSHERGHIACEKHSVHNAVLEMCSTGKIVIHVQRVRVAAQPCKGFHILGGNCLMAMDFVAGLDFLEISKADCRFGHHCRFVGRYALTDSAGDTKVFA